jgi:hypothetical protein
MENLKLTIQEAQETLLMSQSSVYAWIDKGKLQAIEGPNGKLIVISNKEAMQIRDLNLKSRRNKASKQVSSSSEQFQEIPTINAELYTGSDAKSVDMQSDNVTLKLISELKELAIDAGKYKQLEIIRKEEKEQAHYWQEKYFELSAQLSEKALEITALKKQIEEQKALLEKKKSIFGFLNKKVL